ncbi:MAG: NTPase [Candidatus Odinarchaeota archaeon]
MKHNILLTGQPGIGKTTAVKKIVDQLDPKNVAGFWSEEIRERGRRVGFGIETLSGKKGLLAHIGLSDGPRVGKYRVNIEDIDSIIVPEMAFARESDRIVIIDEIASMELHSRNFKEEVCRCLDAKRVLGTIQARRHPFLDEIRSRTDARLFELTMSNRDEIPTQVLELLKH